MAISNWEYQKLIQLIQNKLGIALGPDKQALVLNRLQPLINEHGFKNFSEYYYYLQGDTTGQALATLANRITTNYSYFFREEDHFDFLQRHALPQKTARPFTYQDSNLNIWSAGCSAGEEAYSICMLLQEFFKDSSSQWNTAVLATDIDSNKLNEAYRGNYPADRLKKVPPIIRMNYFNPKKQGIWEVKPEIRAMVHFSYCNLIQSSFPFKGKFFAIFCRNVMIYFNRETIKQLIRKFYDVTEDGGYLFIGMTESLDKTDCPYRYIAPSVYQKI